MMLYGVFGEYISDTFIHVIKFRFRRRGMTLWLFSVDPIFIDSLFFSIAMLFDEVSC